MRSMVTKTISYKLTDELRYLTVPRFSEAFRCPIDADGQNKRLLGILVSWY